MSTSPDKWWRQTKTLCAQRGVSNVHFAQMDAEALQLEDTSSDVALCSVGLMYVPGAERSIREMRRVLRPGVRIALSGWGERVHCGWATLFEIVQDAR